MAKAKECDDVFANILCFHDSAREASLPPAAYIREFWETKQCDEVYNMSGARKQYEDYINRADAGRMQRVLDFKETLDDEKVVGQAVVHFARKDEAELLSALSLPTWLHYQTIVRAERSVADISIFGTVWGGSRVAQAYLRKQWQKRMNPTPTEPPPVLQTRHPRE